MQFRNKNWIILNIFYDILHSSASILKSSQRPGVCTVNYPFSALPGHEGNHGNNAITPLKMRLLTWILYGIHVSNKYRLRMLEYIIERIFSLLKAIYICLKITLHKKQKPCKTQKLYCNFKCKVLWKSPCGLWNLYILLSLSSASK